MENRIEEARRTAVATDEDLGSEEENYEEPLTDEDD